MKKVFVALLVLLLVFSNSVFATGGNVYYDPVLSFSSNILELNNYTHISSNYSYDSWAIYAEEDLTINLTGTNVIDDSMGIYVGGNLYVTGEGTLDVCKLVIDGEIFTSNAKVSVVNGSDYYAGPKVHYPMSVFYENAGHKYFAFYDAVNGTYKDQEGNNYSNLSFFQLADKAELDNICSDSPLYRFNNATGLYDITTENVNGFVIYESGVGATVSYDPTGALHDKTSPVYDVTFYDDLSSSIPKLKYIELAFDESEWGKSLEYEILSTNNAYEYSLVNGVPTFNPFVVGNIYHELDGLVAERSLYKTASDDYVGSCFLTIAITKNNSLSIKVLGKTNPVYININVVDTHNYLDPIPDFIIPNTGIK